MDAKNISKTNLYSLKRELDKNGIFLTYDGPVNQNLIIELIDLIKAKLEPIAPTSTVIKIVTIFIEQTQNIIKYSIEHNSEIDSDTGSGICVIGKQKEHYFIMCGNLIEKTSKSALKKQLDKLIVMNKDELAKLFKKQKKKTMTPESKGAGLGLIDMACKSRKPLDYVIEDVDNNHCFFSITVYI